MSNKIEYRYEEDDSEESRWIDIAKSDLSDEELEDIDTFRFEIVEYNLPQSMVNYELTIKAENLKTAIEVTKSESKKYGIDTIQIVSAHKWLGEDGISWVDLDIPKSLNEFQTYIMDIIIERNRGDIDRLVSDIMNYEVYLYDFDVDFIFDNFSNEISIFYDYLRTNKDDINPFSREGRRLISNKLIHHEIDELVPYQDNSLYPDNEHGFPPCLVDYFEERGVLLRHNRDMDMG